MRRVLNLELLEKEMLLSMAPMREVPAKAGNLSAIHAKLRSVIANTPFYDLRTDEEKVKMALKMAMRGMSVLGIAETLEVKPSTVSTWVSRAGMHCEKVNKVVLNDVETPKVEMDELWTFVGKKRCPGKMNSKTTGLGSG